MEPRIRYAKTSDGVSIAYSIMGDGPTLVRTAPPGITHAQRDWTMYRYMWEPLTSSFRVLFFDSRGTGLSDRDAAEFSLGAMEKDLTAVVDQESPDRFALVGLFDGVQIAVAYAAAQPQRVSHLVLVDGPAKNVMTPAAEAMAALLGQDWRLVTETLARVLVGSDDIEWTAKWAEHIRACCDPDVYRMAASNIASWDVTGLLSKVSAQTLVVNNERSAFTPLAASQELAAGIPDARLAMLSDPLLQGLDELIGEFLSEGDGDAAAAISGFVTILFTDIESSAALRQRLGDAKAQDLVHTHDSIVRDALKSHQGKEIKHTGDGIMSSFSTASSALEAAVAIQRGVAAHVREHPDAPLGVYIGLNAGEPIAEEKDLFGTSVDLARRICDHARPGQVLVSDVVRQLAAGKDFLFSDCGETEMRGFEDPVRLYEVRWREEG